MRHLIMRIIMSALGFLTIAGASAQTTPPAGTPVTLPMDWLEGHMQSAFYSTVISMLGGLIAFAISTLFVVKQMRDTQQWNVRKTSEEMLTSMITGDFPRLMDRLILEFEWDILAHTHYDTVAANATPAELSHIDVILRNVLRHLEVTCINMKNGIIDEEICFDYLRSILTTFYANCDSFIRKERDRRREEKIFGEVEGYARKWTGIIAQERQGVPYRVVRKQFAKAR